MNGAPVFEHPWALAGLLGLIPLFLLDLLRREAVQRAARYLGGGLPGGGGELIRRRLWSALSFYLFFACMIIALAGPRWGSRRAYAHYRGLDLVLALDLSRSMEVRDLPPPSGKPGEAPVSRLERGLSLAAGLVNRAGGGRLGIALGRGRGILALPLSFDTESPLALLEGLGSGSVTGRGTNLEALVDAASGAFDDAFPGRRGIVLISDGEALSGNLGAALDRARERGISLCALGLGTEAGGGVPLEESPGEFLLDEGGQPVLSSRRTGVLREAALRTGGIYLDGNREDAAALLGDYLRSLSSGAGPGVPLPGPGTGPASSGYGFIIAGLGFWALSRRFALRRRGRGGER